MGEILGGTPQESHRSAAATGVFEVSRFSCRKFLGVYWGLRLRRTVQGLALSPLGILPSALMHVVGVPIGGFRSSIPSPPIPLFTLHGVPHDTSHKTRGRVDRYSFLVKLFHLLLPAGLSPRNASPRFLALTKQCAPDRCLGTFGLVGFPLVPFPLASPTRFSSSVRKPG
jgi:hypothetical protein